MGKYFGTDGIRGIANEELDAMLAFRAGQAAATVLAQNVSGKPLFTIGKDTRISGDMLEAALIAGLCSAGADVISLGVVPTPAVAYITKVRGADAGVVISASHNPYEHNGIKIFNVDGFKLSDELENQIEYYIDHPEELIPKKYDEIGNVAKKNRKLVDGYINHIIACAEKAVFSQHGISEEELLQVQNELQTMLDNCYTGLSPVKKIIFKYFFALH